MSQSFKPTVARSSQANIVKCQYSRPTDVSNLKYCWLQIKVKFTTHDCKLTIVEEAAGIFAIIM